MCQRCVAFLVLVSIFFSIIAVLLTDALLWEQDEPPIEGVWTVPEGNPTPCEDSAEEGDGDVDRRAALQRTSPGTDRYGDLLPKGALARLGTVRFRHQIITAVVWSPDGKMLASAGYNNPIRLWDAATGKEIRRFVGGSWNHVLAWSPDGKTIASAWHDGDSTIHLWNAATGKEVRQLDGHDSNGVDSLAWSPDGRTLASGGDDNLVHLWDAATGKQIRQLTGHKDYVKSLSWSPDGKTVSSASDDKTIILWDAATGKKTRRLHGHKMQIWSVHWSPDGQRLASGSEDKTVRLWDAATGKEVRRIVGASSASWSPDGKMLAIESKGEAVHIWKAATGEPVCRISGARDVSWSPDGKVLASMHHHTIRLWDPATGREIQRRQGHESFVTSVCWAPKGRLLASASSDKTIRLWDPATAQTIRTFRGHRHNVESLAWSPDGKTLASGSDYEPYHKAGVEEKNMRLWDAATGKEIRSFIGHTGEVGSLAWSPDGKTLASTSRDHTLRLWDAASGKEIRKIANATEDGKAVIWSPDGKTLAWIGRDNVIRLIDAATGQERRRFVHAKEVQAMAWSPDGRTLVSASDDKAIHLWQAASGKEIQRFAGQVAYIRSLAWSPDGRMLALGCGDDETVRLWEAVTGKEVRRFQGHDGGIWCVDWSRDGLTVASGSSDATILLWDITGLRPDGGWHVKPLTARELEACWAALASADAAEAYDAVWQLVATLEQAVPFLRKKLPPTPRPDAQGVARWIADLDSDDFGVREKANDELSKLGDAIAPALRDALHSKPPLETRRRLQQLLDQARDWTPERLREHRVIQALEHIGTPAARELLRALAEGASQAQRTEEAKAALRRLDH